MASHVSLEYSDRTITIKGLESRRIFRQIVRHKHVEYNQDGDTHCLSFPQYLKRKEVQRVFEKLIDKVLSEGFAVVVDQQTGTYAEWFPRIH